MNLSSMSNVALLVISVYYPLKNSPTKKLTIRKRVAAEASLNQQSIFCSLFIISAQHSPSPVHRVQGVVGTFG
jgi:hypothetical protein